MSAPSETAPRPGWVRGLVGAVVLFVVAGAYWPVAIDDAYISAAYAYELLERGELAWPGAERLEGYSNFLWVLMMALAARLGADVILVAKLVSLVSGLALAGVVAKAAPTTGRGDLVVAAVVMWMPLAYWSAMALETATYTLVVVAGWLLVVEGRAYGLLPLLLATLLRVDGALWWLAGAGAVLAVRRQRAAPWIAATGAAVLAYHLWRVTYFDAWLPAAVHLKAGLGWFAAVQLVEEAIVASSLLAVAALFRLPRGAWRSLVPAVLCVGLLVAMNGDWMARGRVLLPGLVAMVVVRARLGEPRELTGRAMSLVVALVIVASSFEPRFLERPRLRAFVPRYTARLELPLLPPVTYAVEHVPEDGTLASADVGLLGHVAAMTVVDTRGLVSPRFLSARRTGDWSAVEAWWTSPEGPDVVEVSRYQPTDFLETPLEPYAGLDPWLRPVGHVLDRYPIHDDVLYDEGTWRGAVRFHHRVEPAVPESVVARRWRGLAERFPAHRLSDGRRR